MLVQGQKELKRTYLNEKKECGPAICSPHQFNANMASEPSINKENRFKRRFRKSIFLNELELAAFQRYCKKYHIKNEAKFIRETLIREILRRFEEDHPTLFTPEEMRGVVPRKKE